MKTIITAIAGVAIAASIAFIAPAHSMPTLTEAKITFEQFEEKNYLKIDGSFTAGLEERVKTHLKFGPIDGLILKSGGGNLETGYKLGELISENKWKVVIKYGESCLSSCAMAAMGTRDLTIYGQMGIHTPYFPDAGKRAKDILHKEASKMMFRFKGYMNSSGMRNILGWAMVNLTDPSTFIVFDTTEEFEQFRVSVENKDKFAEYNKVYAHETAQFFHGLYINGARIARNELMEKKIFATLK